MYLLKGIYAELPILGGVYTAISSSSGLIRSEEVAIRALKARRSNQVQMDGRPLLSLPRTKDAFGIMATLRMSDWPVDLTLLTRTFPHVSYLRAFYVLLLHIR